MALTVTEIARYVAGSKRHVLATVTFDSSYPTGGESLVAADLGLNKLDALITTAGRSTTPTAYALSYDRTNSKLLAFIGDSDGVADGPGVQVPDTTNIATVSTVVLAIGS